MTLRHRVELYAAVLCAWHLQDAQRALAVEDKAVGVVVDHDDVILASKTHQTLVGLHTCGSACRHIGIVHPHQLHPREIHPLQFVEVGLPAVLGFEVVIDNLGTEYFAQRRIGGVTGIGHKHLVTRIDEGERDMQDAFL